MVMYYYTFMVMRCNMGLLAAKGGLGGFNTGWVN